MEESQSRKHLGFTPELYRAGTHVCMMYNDEAERRSVVHPFVLAGLQDGESVHFWADAMPTEFTKRALDDQSAVTLSKSQLSRLEIANALDTLCPSGEFIAHESLERLRQYYEASLTDGSSGCRVSGDASWLLSEIPGSEDWVLFESSVNVLLRTAPMTTLCGYDTELFDGATLFEVLSVHPLMVIHGQVMRNPYYVEPGRYLAALKDPDLLKESPTESVLGQLLVVEAILTGLPDELRMAEFAQASLMRIPGVRDSHIVLTTTIIPHDERLESIRQRCFEAVKDPSSLDLEAIRDETGADIFLMRSTSRLFGVVIVELNDAGAFAPYQDFLFNIANAVAMAQDSWHDRAESRAWIERVTILEQRLWRISRELEDAGISAHSPASVHSTSLPGINEISERQWAVLNRLLQGERVSHIADALFVSQSTVRNHLSYIFRKVGVHSQEELLDLFRNEPLE